MKSLIYLIVVLMIVVPVFGQSLPIKEWNATVTVVDESGQPVPGANVKVIFSILAAQGKSVATNIGGLSDANGVFHSSHGDTGTSAMLFRAVKEGFYESSQPYELGFGYTIGRWNPAIDLVLRKMEHPIPMYAKRVDSHPPVTGKPVGFDFETGDWVLPYGKGKTSDIFFQWNYAKRSRLDYDAKLVVSFPNQGDGIQEYNADPAYKGSELGSPREAAAEGYLPGLERVNISHPGETAKWDYDANRNYFFRVRTVLDAQGHVKTAQYGKIYGDFMHFRYYFNPTPNDRNVEFDRSHNLFLDAGPFPP